MESRNNLLKTLLAIAGTSFIVACSSDDGDPPPMLDCNATGPSVSLTTTPSLCGADNGEIALAIVGGTGNLTITIDPEPLGLQFGNDTFTAMEPGTYTVEITDVDNCSTTAEATVGFDASDVSYQDSVDPIVQARCAIPGCHDGSNAALPNFTNFSEFQSRAHNNPGGVRQRVKTDDMPRSGNPLSAEEKAAIFCWIDEGAMDN